MAYADQIFHAVDKTEYNEVVAQRAYAVSVIALLEARHSAARCTCAKPATGRCGFR